MSNDAQTQWAQILDPIAEILAAAGIEEDQATEEQLAALQRISSKSFSAPLTLHIKDGHGKEKNPGGKKKSSHVRIRGTVKITAPQNGKWHLVLTDTEAKKIMLERRNAEAGATISFDYRTGKFVQIQIEATWDKKADTTLKVRVDGKASAF